MALADAVRPLSGVATDYDPVIGRAAGARVVCLGEASHGTHEFYRERAEITKRLIVEQGVTAVAAEADWPDAYRVNLYVRGLSDDRDPDEALSDFRRFPAWMWRNTEVVEFIAGLRDWNDALPPERPRVGFYGLDLYSLYTSRGGDRLPGGGRPRCGAPGARAVTPASTTSTETPKSSLRGRLRGGRSPASNRRSRCSWSCAERRQSAPCATGRWPRTATSTPSRTLAWS